MQMWRNPHSFPFPTLLPCVSEGVVPGPPTDLQVIEATKNYVVLSWKPPGQRGHEGIMYFVEKVKSEKIRIMLKQSSLTLSLLKFHFHFQARVKTSLM